jgi:hypothetical protein
MPLLPIPPGPAVAPTGISPGTYYFAAVTVNAYGQITAISNGSSGNGLPHAHINKKITVTGNTSATATATYILAVNSSGISTQIVSPNVTLNTATSGANGLDAGTIAASTWYYLYFIQGTSGTACLLSLASPVGGSTPTLPAGYTSWAYAGPLVTDASGSLKRSLQVGRSWNYVLTASTNTTNYPAVFSANTSFGTAVGATPAFVTYSMAGFLPATASIVLVNAGMVVSSGFGILVISSNPNVTGYGSAVSPPAIIITSYAGSQGWAGQQGLFQLEAGNNLYAAASLPSGTVSLVLYGFWEPF